LWNEFFFIAPQLTRDSLGSVPERMYSHPIVCIAGVLVALACSSARRSSCGQFGQAGQWRIHASAPQESLEAKITFESGASRLVGTMHMSEGWGEPLDYPLDSLSVRGDSIRFRFAPAAILIEGACSLPHTIAVRFVDSMPLPVQTVRGTGSIETTP